MARVEEVEDSITPQRPLRGKEEGGARVRAKKTPNRRTVSKQTSGL